MLPHLAPCKNPRGFLIIILMSDKERLRDGCGGGGGGGGGDEDGDGPTKIGDQKEKKCKGCKKKGKRVSIYRLRKEKKLPKQKGISVSTGCWGRRVGGGGGGGGGGCWLCLKQQRWTVDDSSGESPTSDPNSSEFTFDMLRALIENNDFYSNECNPHLGNLEEDQNDQRI